MHHAGVERYAGDYLRDQTFPPGQHEYVAGQVLLDGVGLERPLAELYADTDINGLATGQTP
jgi:hypothetical protein